MAGTIGLQCLPREVFVIVISELVTMIGVHKAVRLRCTSKGFDTTIVKVICLGQAVAIDDPLTTNMLSAMDPKLKGKALAAHSRSATTDSKGYLQVIARVNHALDAIIEENDPDLVNLRHESIAGAINVRMYKEPKNHAQVEAQNILCGAAIIGNLCVLKVLLECRSAKSDLADVNGLTPYFNQPLVLAATQGHLEVVHYLLEQGALPSPLARQGLPNFSMQAFNEQDEIKRHAALYMKLNPVSALRAAVGSGHQDIVRLLLRPEYRLPTSSTEYLRTIIAGARAGRLDLIEEISEVIGNHYSDFENLNNVMMWAAVASDRKEVVRMLLDHGADVNAFDGPMGHYRGTLERAAAKGHVQMLQFLIEHGADVNLGGLNNRFPIKIAAESGQEEVIELLIKRGADPKQALESAAHQGQAHLIRYLLQKYPDLPSLEGGEIGRQALLSALHTNLTVITILVEAGVSLDKGYGNASQLPLNVAKSRCGLWVVNHLRSLGAEATDEPVVDQQSGSGINVGRIIVSERTWEWTGRY